MNKALKVLIFISTTILLGFVYKCILESPRKIISYYGPFHQIQENQSIQDIEKEVKDLG